MLLKKSTLSKTKTLLKLKLITRISLLFGAAIPTMGFGMGINSMIEFADDSGTGSFTITNTDDRRNFISVLISDINIVNGKLVPTPYNRDNIQQWSLEARPSRTVIDAKLKKDFKVIYQPKNKEKENQDKIYQLTFVPTPYFDKGEKQEHVMQIAIGFAPYFVVPSAVDQPLKFELKHKGATLQMKNNGNSYINASFDACTKSTPIKERDKCSKSAYVLAGRNLTIALPKQMQEAKQMNVELATHRMLYKNNFTLQRLAKVTQ